MLINESWRESDQMCSECFQPNAMRLFEIELQEKSSFANEVLYNEVFPTYIM